MRSRIRWKRTPPRQRGASNRSTVVITSGGASIARRGAPTAGVYVYSRSHKAHADLPTYAHGFLRDEAVRATSLTIDVGEPAPLRLQHPPGFRIVPQSGLELPASRSPLVVTLPTSGRSVTIRMVGVPQGAEVRAPTPAIRRITSERRVLSRTSPSPFWIGWTRFVFPRPERASAS